MELKPPKAKKKSSIAKLISWGKMLKTPLLILLLLGSTNCENDNDIDIDSDISKVKESHARHRHTHSILPNVSIVNKISEIRYLRRHLNKDILNFVMTDYLVDGEVENRVHFNGISAKETYVGENG